MIHINPVSSILTNGKIYGAKRIQVQFDHPMTCSMPDFPTEAKKTKLIIIMGSPQKTIQRSPKRSTQRHKSHRTTPLLLTTITTKKRH
jgi:hypothetical protein